ncbi:MAG: ABC transporter ATP-binding protein [archaeon]
MDKENDLMLRIEGLTVRFDQDVIIRAVDLTVLRGEFIAIVGVSGVGKTTLLNAIAGFVPYQGIIRRPENVGMIFQQYAVFPWMRVESNIGFCLHEKREIDRYLRKIHLEKKRKHYPHMLSGGQQQRVALARSLAAKPQLLLMDEPYGSLDHRTREQMQDWLQTIWESEDITTILVTHSIEEAIYLADRVIVMRDGRLEKEYPIRLPRPRPKSFKSSTRFNRLRWTITDNLQTDETR